MRAPALLNVETWEVAPRRDAEPYVALELDGLFEFRLSPQQAIQIASALAAAAKATDHLQA